MIRVLFDHQIFSLQKYGGISRYFVELYKQFKSMSSSIEVVIPILVSDNEYFNKAKERKPSMIENCEYKGKRPLFYFLNRIFQKFLFSSSKFDIIHSTYFDPEFLNKSKCKKVVTVYDMIHEVFPFYFRNNDRTSEMKRKSVALADRVICISENTKKDLCRYFPIDEKKVDVVYLGSNMKRTETQKLCLPPRYLLFVGKRGQYKNFDNFIKAFSTLSELHSDLSVVACGGGTFSDEEILMLKGLKVQDKVFQRDFSDLDISEVYSRAFCFVFPSLYEGFGIPVLESFLTGCPALLSNRSSLPEIGGDAALYFNPDSVNSIRGQLEQVISNRELRKKMIRSGFEQAKKFPVSKVANDTIEVYKRVLK